MWYVYVLLCEDNSLYTGVSTDVDHRFQIHLSGKGAKYTKMHRPVKVVYQESLASKSEALKRELEIKSWSRQEKIQALQLAL